MDGVNEFSSFLVEPVGSSDADVIKKLGEISGVKEIYPLTEGFISVNFTKPLTREQIREFKDKLKNCARVNEKRLHQLH